MSKIKTPNTTFDYTTFKEAKAFAKRHFEVHTLMLEEQTLEWDAKLVPHPLDDGPMYWAKTHRATTAKKKLETWVSTDDLWVALNKEMEASGWTYRQGGVWNKGKILIWNEGVYLDDGVRDVPHTRLYQA